MTVYVVHIGECSMGDHSIIGVFSTEAAAEKVANPRLGFVEQFEMDEVNE